MNERSGWIVAVYWCSFISESPYDDADDDGGGGGGGGNDGNHNYHDYFCVSRLGLSSRNILFQPS